jgi:hypothetical protein
LAAVLPRFPRGCGGHATKLASGLSVLQVKTLDQGEEPKAPRIRSGAGSSPPHLGLLKKTSDKDNFVGQLCWAACARPLKSYVLDSRMSSDRLVAFAATVEIIPNMSRREEQAWRIASVVAVAAGLVLALAITFT